MPYWLENIMKKRRYCLLQAVSPFLTMFSAAIIISLVPQNATLCGNGLILYFTIPSLNNPKETDFLKTLWEKKKMLETSIFFFSKIVLFTGNNKFQSICWTCQAHCYGRPLLQAWLFPDLKTIPNNCIGRILFSSVVMELAFQPGGPCSNPVRILYFCHAFIHVFLCYEL